MIEFTIRLTDEQLAQIAERVAALLADQQAATGDGWLRGADQIARHIGAPRSRVYALASAGAIPVEKDGSALVARRSELDQWVRAGGGRRR